MARFFPWFKENIKNMTKGHNKGKSIPQSKQKGGDEHITGKKKQQVNSERKGRNKEDDQSFGKKGKNSI
jgi:hypothetical protein